VLVVLAAACSDDRPRNFVNAFAPPAEPAPSSTSVEATTSVAPAAPTIDPAAASTTTTTTTGIRELRGGARCGRVDHQQLRRLGDDVWGDHLRRLDIDRCHGRSDDDHRGVDDERLTDDHHGGVDDHDRACDDTRADDHGAAGAPSTPSGARHR
jgi:hypothetical protein